MDNHPILHFPSRGPTTRKGVFELPRQPDQGVAALAPPTVPLFRKKADLVPVPPPPRVPAPGGDPESLADLFRPMVKNFARTLPKIIPQLAIALGIILVLNAGLQSIQTWRISPGLARLVGFFTWIFAIYTSVLAKTVFWIIILTVGRSLFRRFRKEGFAKVIGELRSIPGSLKQAWTALGDRALYALLAGGGLGLALCNFMTKNNRTNKYCAAIVLALTLIYAMGAGSRDPLFVFGRVGAKDAGRLWGKPFTLTDNHIFLLVGGILAGLALDFIVMLVIPWFYIGYILGAVVLAAAITLGLTIPKTTKAAASR